MNNIEIDFPLISIISVNYNQTKVTLEFLDSLKDISYPNVEIIIVDNGSPIKDADSIIKKYPKVILIKSDKNLGFAGGNNLGVRVAKGDYFLFINNDTEVPKGFLEPLVELLKSDKTIGMVSPKIKFHWDPTLIQYAGFTKINPYTLRNKGIGYRQKDSAEFDTLSETESIHGAAMMVPRRVIEKVGMMTEVYFLYYEEHDWAEMVKRAGYKIYYQPASYILHKESISTGKDSPFKTYYINRNRIVFARRNYSGLPFFISMLFQTFVSIPKNIVVYILKRQFKHLAAYCKAITWNLTNYSIINSNTKL